MNRQQRIQNAFDDFVDMTVNEYFIAMSKKKKCVRFYIKFEDNWISQVEKKDIEERIENSFRIFGYDYSIADVNKVFKMWVKTLPTVEFIFETKRKTK